MDVKKIAVVTGASRGIGAAIAEQLAQDGFNVGINFKASTLLAERVLTKITSQGGSAFLMPFDIADPAQVEKAFEAVIKEHGPIFALVNNAGVNRDQLILRQSNESIDEMINTNLKGAIYCSREAIKSMMRAKQGGSVVMISSVVGESGNAGQSIYSATKAALLGLAKSLAREVASRQIRVNAVTPGFIHTDMTENLTEPQKEAILRSIPLGTLGEPKDVAQTVSFLTSPASQYMTGQVLGVNGGMYL